MNFSTSLHSCCTSHSSFHIGCFVFVQISSQSHLEKIYITWKDLISGPHTLLPRSMHPCYFTDFSRTQFWTRDISWGYHSIKKYSCLKKDASSLTSLMNAVKVTSLSFLHDCVRPSPWFCITFRKVLVSLLWEFSRPLPAQLSCCETALIGRHWQIIQYIRNYSPYLEAFTSFYNLSVLHHDLFATYPINIRGHCYKLKGVC
jgi:hypothetical protein